MAARGADAPVCGSHESSLPASGDLDFHDLLFSTSPHEHDVQDPRSGSDFEDECLSSLLISTPTVLEVELGDTSNQNTPLRKEEESEEGVEGRTMDIAAKSTRSSRKRHKLADYEKLRLVGQGAFGKVFQVRHRETGKIYAMKALKKEFLAQTDQVSYTRQERDVLTRVTHPNIVLLHAAFQTKGRVYLVMNFVNGGQLLFHLRNKAWFKEASAKFYIAQIILAIHYLHSIGIIHRDLKPENILLDAEGNVCLTDFGFAKETDGNTGTYCGTTEYMAPEIIAKKPYSFPADWWSLGCVSYDILSGNPPFRHKNVQTLHKQILTAKIKFPKYISGEAVALLKGLLHRDINKRMGTDISKLKNMSFFRGISWKKLLHKEITPPFTPDVTHGSLDTSQFDKKWTSTTITHSPEMSPTHALSQSQEQYFLNFSYVRSPEHLGAAGGSTASAGGMSTQAE
mmetsp:Transcript_30828/g.86397  ORF Transcript_30828/g.86397 Transcript_30828/m.86397 type:complete len:455 (+) Transcript_30828:151-1515(+)